MNDPSGTPPSSPGSADEQGADCAGTSGLEESAGALVRRSHLRIGEALRAKLTPETDVALLDFPDHLNVGDYAIWLGQHAALWSIGHPGPRYTASHKDFDSDVLRNRVPEGPILLSGGGNLGDLYPQHQGFRERVVRAFPDRRIVILPQSIHFETGQALDRARRVFASHSDLHLMVRTSRSLELARRHFDVPVQLCPDMAFALGGLAPTERTARNPLLLLRGDAESTCSHEEANRHVAGWDHVDWGHEGRIPGRWEGIAHWLRWSPTGPSGVWGRAVRDYAFSSRTRTAWAMLLRGIEILSGRPFVVTDRLHGHILALLMGIPHAVVDNSYGKNWAYVETWTEDCPLTHRVDTPEEARRLYEEPASATVRDRVGAPRASIVIATRDRAPKLAETLRRLADLRSDHPWELVLVDNGSADDTIGVMRSFGPDVEGRVRIVEEDEPGWGAAKNTGVRASRGQIVISIDDDCYPDPDFVDAVVRHFGDSDLGYIGGRILLHDPTDRPVTINTRTEPERLPAGSFVPAGLIQGANMAFRRTVFDELGGFDELFGAGASFSGGDVEFAARASAHGWEGAYVPDAVVYHAHGRKSQRAVDRLERWYDRGRGAYYVKMILDSDLRDDYLKHWWWSWSLDRRGAVLREVGGGLAYLWKRAVSSGARHQPRIGDA